MILGQSLLCNVFNPIFWIILFITSFNLAIADPYPPTWTNSAGTAADGIASHYMPVAWPTEPSSPLDCGKACGEWLPYTRFQNEMADPRTKDPSNGGTSPQSYVNVASSCIDKSLPSIYYSLHQGTTAADDVLMFRWRVESAAHTYATGPNTGKYGSSAPWSSALWTVFFDLDGSGYRSLAAHLDGSIGSPSAAIDRMVGIWGSSNNNSLDYVNDPSIFELGHNPTAFVGTSSKLLNFQSSLTPTESWPNGSAETVWDYGTSRAISVSKNSCTEYFIDYQIPITMLDASANGGPKITRDTPISMMFCTANSLNNPLQKDCAIGKEWLANPESPAPFGDYLSFNQTTPYSQPIISVIDVTPPASCPGTYQLAAKVQDTLALNNGEVIASVQAVDFYYWYDANGDGAATTADVGSEWIKIANTGALESNSLNTWKATWDAATLFKGKYLIGAQALDDNTALDDNMTPSGINNRTFSYLSGSNSSGTANQIYIDNAWLSGEQAKFPSHSPSQSPLSTENWYGNPDVTGQQIALVGTAINACGVAPTIALSADKANVEAGGTVTYTVTIANPTTNSAAITLSQIDNVLPEGFSYKASSTTGVTTNEPAISGQTLTWTLDSPLSIAAGSSSTLAFSSTATSTSGTYNDVASAVTSFDTLTSSPLAIAVDSVRLSLSNTPDSTSVAADNTDEITFTLNYSNDSSVLVTSPTISTTIEANSNYVSCAGGSSCSKNGSTLTWTLADISGGASGSVSYKIKVSSTWPTTSLTSSATLSVTAPDSSNSSVTAASTVAVTGITIAGTPTLTFTNTADKMVVAAGGTVTYTLAYKNVGNGSASNVSLVNTLPAGMTYSSCTGTGCSNNANVVTWNLGALSAGASGTVTVSASAADPFIDLNPATNSANLSFDEGADRTVTSDVQITSADGKICNRYYFSNQTADVGSAGTKNIAVVSPIPVATNVGFSKLSTLLAATKQEAIRFYQDPIATTDVPFSGNITDRKSVV